MGNIEAETSGVVVAILNKDEYLEHLESSGLSSEDFNKAVEQKNYDTWNEMENDNSLYAYKGQENVVEVERVEISTEFQDEDLAIIVATYEGTESAEYGGDIDENRNPYSMVEKYPDDDEMPNMVGKVLKETLSDMGFKDIDIQNDEYQVIDWDEKLNDKLNYEQDDYGYDY
jgi:hypothetical protein